MHKHAATWWLLLFVLTAGSSNVPRNSKQRQDWGRPLDVTTADGLGSWISCRHFFPAAIHYITGGGNPIRHCVENCCYNTFNCKRVWFLSFYRYIAFYKYITPLHDQIRGHPESNYSKNIHPIQPISNIAMEKCPVAHGVFFYKSPTWANLEARNFFYYDYSSEQLPFLALASSSHSFLQPCIMTQSLAQTSFVNVLWCRKFRAEA